MNGPKQHHTWAGTEQNGSIRSKIALFEAQRKISPQKRKKNMGDDKLEEKIIFYERLSSPAYIGGEREKSRSPWTRSKKQRPALEGESFLGPSSDDTEMDRADHETQTCIYQDEDILSLQQQLQENEEEVGLLRFERDVREGKITEFEIMIRNLEYNAQLVQRELETVRKEAENDRMEIARLNQEIDDQREALQSLTPGETDADRTEFEEKLVQIEQQHAARISQIEEKLFKEFSQTEALERELEESKAKLRQTEDLLREEQKIILQLRSDLALGKDSLEELRIQLQEQIREATFKDTVIRHIEIQSNDMQEHLENELRLARAQLSQFESASMRSPSAHPDDRVHDRIRDLQDRIEDLENERNTLKIEIAEFEEFREFAQTQVDLKDQKLSDFKLKHRQEIFQLEIKLKDKEMEILELRSELEITEQAMRSHLTNFQVENSKCQDLQFQLEEREIYSENILKALNDERTLNKELTRINREILSNTVNHVNAQEFKLKNSQLEIQVENMKTQLASITQRLEAKEKEIKLLKRMNKRMKKGDDIQLENQLEIPTFPEEAPPPYPQRKLRRSISAKTPRNSLSTSTPTSTSTSFSTSVSKSSPRAVTSKRDLFSEEQTSGSPALSPAKTSEINFCENSQKFPFNFNSNFNFNIFFNFGFKVKSASRDVEERSLF
eukprot:TRINITY_DN6103_c0_g1_i1.p1 TRINITY_DN6103_c0_g1~~TRINITY_DN6103_c0_g1_i1.p1  ORF type:complete len:671 (-),score=273.82 TRINITY_DN6103_c0_g1_i1:36-2048(-)